jgi:hypothetical protein
MINRGLCISAANGNRLNRVPDQLMSVSRVSLLDKMLLHQDGPQCAYYYLMRYISD